VGVRDAGCGMGDRLRAFSGGETSDLFGYYPGNGTLWVAENRGNRF
jgi:hypothetical protein